VELKGFQSRSEKARMIVKAISERDNDIDENWDVQNEWFAWLA
jgi:hypothetical protein